MTSQDLLQEVEDLKHLYLAMRAEIKSPFDELVLDTLGILMRKHFREVEFQAITASIQTR